MVRKTTQLRGLLKKGTVVAPGAFNAITAKLIERTGFEAVYISGAGIINGLTGFPDIGLLTMTEVVTQARYIADAVEIPAIADADTGYGEALNVVRTVREFERAGVAGIHIEDQVSPKRCGHLSGKQLIPVETMTQKLRAAVEAKTDPDFLIIARTDARGVTGFEDAVERAKRYIDAGADAIFPEALETEEDFATFVEAVPDVPLLANMTEFGKSPYLTVEQFASMGYRIVIFPMTAFRVAMKAVEEMLIELQKSGTQAGLLNRMQTRQELYELIHYSDYEQLDRRVAR
ncbi:MAG: methylisocitrate lyase [Candidatus Latescibacteria bacterium]|nr:methylisocitrate lyase [Candidatus Latescibacterota bacterium]